MVPEADCVTVRVVVTEPVDPAEKVLVREEEIVAVEEPDCLTEGEPLVVPVVVRVEVTEWVGDEVVDPDLLD